MEILDNKQLTEKLGAISEFLNDKCDLDLHNTNPLARTVVEVSDKSLLPSWYRVYSDGWCEQGGTIDFGSLSNNLNFTVQYLKMMKDTNYDITICPIRGEVGNYKMTIGVETKTANGMAFGFYSDTTRFGCWKVSGYLAEGEY